MGTDLPSPKGAQLALSLDGDLPSPKGAQLPAQFSAHVRCGQTAGWIKMPLDREVDVGPGDIVLHGDPAPPQGHSPQFLAHVCCGRTAGWMKMLLGVEVGLGPDDIVLNGDPAPLERGTAPPSV